MSKYVEEKAIKSELRDYLYSEATGIADFTQVSARGHFIAAERWTSLHLWVGLPTALMAALASASALSQFEYHTIIAALLGIMVTALTAVITFLNPSEKAYSHTNAGNKYLSISNEARIFGYIDCYQVKDAEKLIDQLKEFTNRRNELNESSPLIPSWANEKARKRYEKARTAEEKARAPDMPQEDVGDEGES